jgi:hemerythrin superfamily protein
MRNVLARQLSPVFDWARSMRPCEEPGLSASGSALNEEEVDMANRKQDRDSGSDWAGGATGALVGAAMAGAAVGLAANVGRKLFVQFASGTSGDWVDTLTAEHKLALALFEKIETTDDSQTMMRAHLLTKLKNALAKHALQEENVIYPALREANERTEADHLNDDHGYIKTYLYELENLEKDDPSWLPRVRDFHAMIQEHMGEEEEDIFPALRAQLSPDQNAKLGTMMLKEGMKLA